MLTSMVIIITFIYQHNVNRIVDFGTGMLFFVCDDGDDGDDVFFLLHPLSTTQGHLMVREEGTIREGEEDHEKERSKEQGVMGRRGR